MAVKGLICKISSAKAKSSGALALKKGSKGAAGQGASAHP
jgi:hypothetical protein